MKLFSILLLQLILVKSYSQNKIYVGTKSYDATSTWMFLKKDKYANYQYDATLDVTIAKSKNGGYLMLSTGGVFFETQSIGGTISIYLKDGRVITLTNRLHKDFADEKSTVIYSVSLAQLNILKIVDILQIRYNLVSSYSKTGFTAQNRYNKSFNLNEYDEGVYVTSKEINELFKD